MRLKILNQALEYAKDIGFTDQALVKATMDQGLSPAAVGMFGRGATDLVDFAMEKWYEQLKVELDELDLERIGLKGRLKTGIKTRLQYQIPYQRHWAAAMALGLHPYNFPQVLYRHHKISDHIWYVAGDDSLDYNWYTKRAALSTVYATTELYMVQDQSKDFRDTWEFLDNRINDIIQAGGMAENIHYTIIGMSRGLLSMASAFMPEGSYTKEADEFERAQARYQAKEQAKKETHDKAHISSEDKSNQETKDESKGSEKGASPDTGKNQESSQKS
uniref:Ubiquinone biosynthesis protein n=1 Tax=Euplotes crassus TaxID=5936 RepID=A0A7S3KIC5_EUPCR|mmetsp:Transcript_24173/g.24100  ORF Transcript_24173/g.24100 Transcript_24173/m.24100 type:complete len:275 (+) Transcript_24173:97-921(+)